MTTSDENAWHWRAAPRPEDAPAVRAMVAATGFFRPDEVDVAVELVDTALRDGPAAGYEFLFAAPSADPEATPAGYVCYGPIPCTVRRYDLYWIVVDPAWQRRGLGAALLKESLARMARAGGERCFLSTSDQELYASTRSFYERNGGSLAARVREYYQADEDLLIYTWRLA